MADKFIVKTGVDVKTNQVIDTDGKWIGPASSYIGPQGAQGPQGNAGVVGSQGSQGVIGAQGAPGSSGSQGAPGSSGSQGTQGIAGVSGPTGFQGFQGATGRQGAQGAQGPQGATGGAGITGATGRQGSAGPQGPIGGTGATGRPGVQGPQGAGGSTGATGRTGAQGPQGAQGPRGPTGPTGAQGRQGATGAGGRAGATGPTFAGPTGRQGRQGRPGSAGAAITRVSRIAVNTSLGPTGTLRASGDIIAGFSDQRLKNVIGPIDNPLKKIQHFDGVYYQPSDLAYQVAHENSSLRKVGFIAQEIQKVLPEVISIAPFDSNKHGHSISGENYLTVNYSKVIPLLIEALKEQKVQIEYIRDKIKPYK